MILAPRLPEPEDFDARVRRPGKAWLAANPAAKRPHAYWAPYTAVLEAGCQGLCSYAAMLDPTGGTVDHFLSFRNHPALAYEWRNYRFASATMNSCKGNADDTVLDPQQVRAGWFEIVLPSLQLRLTDRVPQRLRAKAAYTLRRLKLDNGERVVRWRQSWYQLYTAGQLDLAGLRRVAPLIADAVERAARA
ncbi:MAG TPA: hypothetical protein P5163_06160 [Rubrivivax sp.]|nr:hypothetical protein [Rubrivivax sp.]HRY87753.1 hypothetical protein [Rubrivivax sp.]HRZ60162.1 hypothetical protein [Rubrivivax sp.]